MAPQATTLRACQALKDGVTLRVVHVATPEPAQRADVRQDSNDGQQVLIFRAGVIVSTLHWNDAKLLGQALVLVASERCPTQNHYVHLLKNAATVGLLHRDYAKELGSELQRVGALCEAEHWIQCEKKLGRPMPLKSIFGIPLLDSPQELERID